MTRVGIFRWIALLLTLEVTNPTCTFLTSFLSGQPNMIMSRQTFRLSFFESVLLVD
jgi:hypothetical protein